MNAPETPYADRLASLTFEELRLERTRVAEECGAKILLAQQYADIEREWETRFAA